MAYEYNTNRSEDKRLEGITNEFLEKYYIPKMDEAEWVNDRDRQVRGVDIILTSAADGLDHAKTDIKSAVKYSDRYLPTYSLELSFINKGLKEQTGWLLDDRLETEYYLLLYPHSGKHYTDIKTVDDIDYIDYYLVKKEDILRFLLSRGYGKEELLDVSASMREEYDGGSKLIRESKSENFHFSLSGNMPEKPINVVVKRRVYDRYAIKKGRITRED